MAHPGAAPAAQPLPIATGGQTCVAGWHAPSGFVDGLSSSSSILR
jgi:hypothetical protein